MYMTHTQGKQTGEDTQADSFNSTLFLPLILQDHFDVHSVQLSIQLFRRTRGTVKSALPTSFAISRTKAHL